VGPCLHGIAHPQFADRENYCYNASTAMIFFMLFGITCEVELVITV
jgi:hypothetical protein